MSFKSIRDIKVDEPIKPLQIRVLRKWKPYNKPLEQCYLFVDIHGGAIEAICSSHEALYFDTIIHMQSCYTLTKYVTVPSRTFMAVVPHRASLRFGTNASFEPLTNSAIPTNYYDFVPYSVVETRKVNLSLKVYPPLLTDYIGRVERIRALTTKTKKPFLKILVQNEENNVVEVTVWDKDLFHYETQESIKKVIAVTSTIVTEYNGTLQLETTPATTITINPTIPELSKYVNKYQDLKVPKFVGYAEKKATLADLLTVDINEKMGSRFVCTATVTEISSQMRWYYADCSECQNRLYPQADGLTCLDHGVITNPTFMYSVHATITDHTAAASVIFFNEAMESFVNISCKDMVVKKGYTSQKTIPHPILSLRGVSKTLHINKKKDGTLAVNDVSDPLPDPTPATPPSNLPHKRKEYMKKASHSKQGRKKAKEST